MRDYQQSNQWPSPVFVELKLKVINNIIPSKFQEKHVYSKDLKTVANDFNSYFSSVGSRTADAVAQLARDNNFTYLNFSSPSPALSSADCFSINPVSCEVVNVWTRVSVHKNKTFLSLATQDGRRVIKACGNQQWASLKFVKLLVRECKVIVSFSAFLLRISVILLFNEWI